MIQLTLKSLLYLMAITLTMGALQYNVNGLNLPGRQVFGLAFVGLFLLALFVEGEYRIRLPRPLRELLTLLFIFYCFKLLSVLGVVGYSMHPDAMVGIAFRQYAKGVINDGMTLLLLFCMAAYLSMINSCQRHRVAQMFVFGVLASCVYQLVSLLVIKSVDVELDRLLWPTLSYNLKDDYVFLRDQVFGAGGIVFYRAGGFAINPNSFAAQLVCVIPLFILFALYRRRSYVLWAVLATLSLMLTFSRTGILAVGIAGLLLVFGQFYRIATSFKVPIIVVGSALTVMGIWYSDELMLLLGSRFNQQSGYGFVLGAREDLFDVGMQIVADYPLFGVGHNNSPLLLQHFPQVANVTGADFHNFWLTKLIELGVVGLAAYLFVHLFILWRMWHAQRENIYAKALFYSLVGLTVAGFFNNNLSVVPIQILIFVFYCVACLDDEDKASTLTAKY